MAELVTPDICVIGAGSGGLSVAAAAAAFGVGVVLIEKGEMGGDCLNFGCVPSKALLAAARQAQTLRQGAAFGIADVEPTVDFAAVARHVEATIAEIAPNDSAARFTALGVQVMRAEACFVDRRTVAAGDRLIRARRFVIATGSAPRIPPIPGLAQVAFLTNETIFALRKRPAHLLVIGAGPVGLELAQAFRRLGSEVTVIEAARPLATADPEAAAVVTGALAREGVRLLAAATVVEARKQGRSGVRLLVETAGREHRSTAPTCWSPPAAARMSRASGSMSPASPTTRRALPSATGCAPPTGASMRWATSSAVRNSPMSRATTRRSSSAPCSSACPSGSTRRSSRE